MSLALEHGLENEIQFIGWQAEPITRGTWSILWSSVATLALCVYTTLHISVLWRSGLWRKIEILLKWGCTGLFIPEVLLYIAWREWHEARHLTAKMKELCDERKSDKKHVPHYLEEWSMMHSFFVLMGGVVLDQAGSKGHGTAYLAADGIVELVREEQDNALAAIDAEGIEDRSKASILTKSITAVQASHSIMLVIVRLGARKTVSALELLACAHVPVAIMLIGLWWHKPYDAQTPIVLTVRNSILNNPAAGHYHYIKDGPEPSEDQPVFTTEKPQDTNYGRSSIKCSHLSWASCLAYFGSVIISGTYLFFWNAHFPTPIERWLWRASCIFIAAIGITLALFRTLYLIIARKLRKDPNRLGRTHRRHCFHCYYSFFMFMFGFFVADVEDGMQRRASRVWTWARDRCYVFMAVLYVAARVYLVIESFLSLRSLPADVYIVPAWTSIIPHFG